MGRGCGEVSNEKAPNAAGTLEGMGLTTDCRFFDGCARGGNLVGRAGSLNAIPANQHRPSIVQLHTVEDAIRSENRGLPCVEWVRGGEEAEQDWGSKSNETVAAMTYARGVCSRESLGNL